MKVSFDFDQTLDKLSVQDYAKELVDNGIEVWVCTSRIKERSINPTWNDDLYEVCDNIGIKRDHINFCEMSDKYEFFKDKDFIWHLDDDWIELDMINKHTNTIGISVFGQTNWQIKCNRLLHTKNKQQ